MLVSVIIPAYNRETAIRAAVESVLGQTYDNLEVIVVDDCSDDGTVDVVRSIADERVRVIECDKNGGACVARNIGVDNAKGDIVAFHDSDDIWYRDKLEKCIAAIERENADFVFHALRREETKKGNKITEILPSYNLNGEKDKLAKLICHNCVSTQTIVVKRHVLDRVRFDMRFPRFQDWEFAIHVVKEGYKVYYLDEPLVDCYVQGDSITSDGSKAVKALGLLEEKYMDDYKKYPDMYKIFCERGGYLVEMSGRNGTEYFRKAYRLNRRPAAWIKYMLAKIRLYRPLNKLVSRFMA